MLKKLHFKSWLLMLCMLLGVGNAWAQSDYSSDYTGNVTLSTTGGTQTNTCKVVLNGTEYSGIKAGTSKVTGAMKIIVPSGTKYLHIHAAGWKGETVTLSVTPSGYSSNIALTSNDGISSNSPFTFDGDASSSDYYKVVTFGTALTNDTELTFSATSGKRFVIWGVTAENESAIPTVATPMFDPAGGTYSEAQSVTISCSTEGAAIQYSTDNGATWTNYMAAISVSETTTIQAKATKTDYNDSQVATATYTIVAPITIAAARTQATGSVFTKGVVTSCVGVTGYIQDATAAICVYGTSLTVGDEITVSGTLSTYKGLLEITSPSVTVLSHNNTVTPTIMTIADINATNAPQGKYVKIVEAIVTAIDGQNTTIEQDGASIVVRGISSDVEYAVGDALTLEGNIGCFDVVQIANPQNVEVKKSEKQEAGLAYTTTEYTINLGESFATPTLTNPNNLVVTYTSSNEVVATVATDGAVTLVEGATGTTTITASFAGNDTYLPGSASYTLTVVDPNAPGASADNPYTVAQARAAIDAGTGVTGVYATGIVSKIVTAYNATYGNITYNISADGSEEGDQLQAYRGFSYNGENFNSADDIQVGDVVVICGNLKKHNDTYEFDSGNQLVSLIRKPVIIASSVTLDYDATSGEIAYTIENPVTDTALNVSTDVDWISDIVVDATVITFAATANEGDADRTATITLTYGDVTKDVIVTQGHYVEYVDFAVLPFEWAGGASADLLALNGVSADGLGSDYAASNAPYLIKLDTNGDYILVKTDSRPGTVTIGVKMIGGANTSTITVQGSSDGETFTDIEALTISGAQNAVLTLVTSEDFAEDVRFVKLLFTKGSNVGVGPISIAKYSGTVIEKYAVNINESISNGTVAADKEEAAEGATVTLTVEPAEGYVLDVLTVTGVSGEVEVSEDYKFTMPAEAVTVTATFKRATYVTYTLASAITSGKHYIIVGEKDGKYQAMGEQKSNNRGAVEVSVIGGTASVVQNSGVYEFIISGNVEDGFTIYDENTQSTGYLYAAGFDKNYLKTQTENDANGIWTITIEENGKASIVAEGSTNRNVMQYNSSNSLFACYASASQSPVYLYEKALKGDVNGDGQVSIADVTALVNIILGKATPESNPEYNFDAANVNGDDDISIADVTALVNIILGKDQ